MSETKKPEPLYPVDLDGAAEILLGGKPWKVPRLAHGQNKRVVPIMSALLPKIMRAMATIQRADLTSLSEHDFSAMVDVFDEKAYDDMGRAVFWGLKRAYPGLAEAEFEAFPIDPIELLIAAFTVGMQSGFFKRPAPGEKSGEPSAAAPSTGTASPPASAASPDGPGST